MKKLFVILFALPLLLACAGRSGEPTPQSAVQSGKEVSEAEVEALANGHEYVDLGICNHLRWATMNLGATHPCEPGDLFKWGVTQPWQRGTKCYWDDYPYYMGTVLATGGPRLSKYNTNREQFEELDNLTCLEPEDDAAHVLWGGGWRMPDGAELDSLLQLCTWTTDTVNGRPGYRATSKLEGYRDRSIFLPYTGGVSGLSFLHADRAGYYWSRNILDGYAFPNGIGIVTDEKLCLTFYFRYQAMAIRPVFLPGEVLVSQVDVSTRKSKIQLGSEGIQLSAQVQPANASNQRLYWNTSDLRVATVDSTGFVHPQSEGICYITATSTDGTSCSSTCMVTVFDPNQPGHPYVDLGICHHLRWATANVGALSEEQSGDYFDARQAQQVVWGDHWRLPTAAELDSLLTCCRWEWTTVNGVPGYKVTNAVTEGYKNTSIFLPAAGCYDEGGVTRMGSFGYYWSSSALTDIPGNTINLAFSQETPFWNYSPQRSRFPIRMVYSTHE